MIPNKCTVNIVHESLYGNSFNTFDYKGIDIIGTFEEKPSNKE
jgi:hypothetical protein